MKKNLAKAVVLGLMCASVFAGSAYAYETEATLDIDDTTTQSTFVGREYYGATDGDVIKIAGNNDKNITFNSGEDSDSSISIAARESGNIGILNVSSGNTTINSTGELVIISYPVNGTVKAISNQAGKLIFTNDVYANGVVENKSGATLEFDKGINISVTVLDENEKSVGLVNEGTFNIKGKGQLIASAQTLDSIGGSTSNGSFYNDYSSLYAIDNRGVMDVNASAIIGNIKHNTGAQTNINLQGYSGTEGSVGSFSGNIIDSDANFSLTLNEYAYWEPRNQQGTVEGITLNKGFIALSVDNYEFYETSDESTNNTPVYQWNSNFDTLKLKNIKGVGGYLTLSTDLANDVGDKFEFTGTVPDGFQLGVAIWNKDDNNGVPIKREDGHSVTIISAPSDADMKVGAQLGFYGQYVNSFLYNPIIDEIVEGNVKNWNFVGWEKGGNKTVDSEGKQGKDALDLNATELDNTLKRINDIRTDPSEVGAWLRGENGKMKIRSYGYKYNLMSGGYDWKYESDAAKMFLGFGISYAKNNCDTGIIGDTKSMGYNLYGSWLGRENNDYLDVIVKYGTLDKKYAGLDDNNVFVTGDYDKKLFSVAAKYGRRITRDDGWYYEPSVGLTWGRIGSADFTDSQGINIHADSSTSKMATLGMQVGKNIQGTEFYGLFQVRHDFDGKMHVSVPGSDLPGSSVYDDMGGTWYKVGIGAARKINKNNSFYMDIEKDFGNKVKKPYAIGAGYRYTF